MAKLIDRLLRRQRGDGDFADEIAAHLAIEADRLVSDGMSPRDALLEARRRFGNVGQSKERFHERQTIGWMERVAGQLRAALRRLVRAPVFSVTAVLTVMLGIGATTAVFSLVDHVLLRPLPFPASDRLVEISHTITLQGLTQIDQSDATFLYYRSANHVFTNVGAFQTTAVNLSETASGDVAHAQRVDAARASAGAFKVLGIAPERGRAFQDAEDVPGAAPVAIVGDGLWRDQFGGDPNIIGRTVMVDGVARQIVGVMPASFAFPDDETQLWLPIGIDPARTNSAAFDFHVIARLRPGATAQTAQVDLAKLLPRVPEVYPGRLTAQGITLTKMQPVVRPLAGVVVGDVGRTLWVVFGAAAFLLLIACANVANLFLVRADERQHELAVRRALGAGRGAITGEFLSEAVIIAVAGAALGVLLAAVGLQAVSAHGASISIPRVAGVGVDGPVVLAALAATAVTILLVCVVPAIRFGGSDVTATLGQTGRALTAGRTRHRARQAFVVIQVALALVLVAGAGVMARSFAALRSVDPGFDAANAYTFRVALPSAEYPTASSEAALVSRAIDRIASAPGVRSVGVLSKLPLDAEAREDSGTWVEDRPPRDGALPGVHQVAFASANAFAALGVSMIQGREFGTIDPANPPSDAIVTRALARRYWGDSAAVGRHIGFSPVGPWFTVVGVTNDIRGSGLDQPPDETVYLPLLVRVGGGTGMGASGAPATIWTPSNLAFVVRSSGESANVAGVVARALRDLAPTVPLYSARSLEEVLSRSTARVSFTLALLEIASLAALLIGAVGLYGVVSYVVGLRRKELAVRVALGAQPGALRRQVLVQAVGLAAVGIVLGVAGAVSLMRVMSSLLFDVTATDPSTLAGAVVVMAIVAVGASWVPARRAGTVAPAEALRADG